MRVELKIKSNDGLVAISDAHPDATFVLRGAWPNGDEISVLVETGHVRETPLCETLSALPEIREYEIQYSTDEFVRFQARTKVPDPHGATAGSGVVPSFPKTLEDGWLIGELVTSREQLTAFRDELRTAGIEHEITAVSTETAESALLTKRQREVATAALNYGYYTQPRECTLTELAERVGADKSVVSRVLHRAESRLVADHFARLARKHGRE